jgi:hypothetical protein
MKTDTLPQSAGSRPPARKPRNVPVSAATAARVREHLTCAMHEAGLDLRRTSKSAIEAVILGALQCAADAAFRFDCAEVES